MVSYMEGSLADPRNTVVVNLDKVPRTASRLVAFRAPFVLIDPVRAHRARRYGVGP